MEKINDVFLDVFVEKKVEKMTIKCPEDHFLPRGKAIFAVPTSVLEKFGAKLCVSCRVNSLDFSLDFKSFFFKKKTTARTTIQEAPILWRT